MPLLSRAPTLCGSSWSLLPQPTAGPDANVTYNSQPTFVLPYHCTSGKTVLLYMGDRWNYRGPGGVRCPEQMKVLFVTLGFMRCAMGTQRQY